MLSRVAQNIYWFARYVERAENTARLINVNGNLLLDLPGEFQFGWSPLLLITGSRATFDQHYEAVDETRVINFLLGDPRNPGSVLSSLSYARENLRTTRDVIPREAWEQLNDLYLFVRDRLPMGLSRRGRYEFLKRIILGSQTLTGLLAGSMSHTHAYHFLRLGRHLEGADMTTRIIDVRSANLLRHTEELTPFDNIQWMSVLKSLSGYQMYRQQVRLRVRGPDVLRFLLQDTLFPRAVNHSLEALEACLERLPRSHLPRAKLAQLRDQVIQARVAELAHTGLHEFIDLLQIGMGEIHNAIADVYFPRLPTVETEPASCPPQVPGEAQVQEAPSAQRQNQDIR